MKLSIITIHLNDFAGLGQTCDSLKGLLSRENLEWIVVDGGSFRQDGDILETVELLSDNFVSEPDDSIYDAMNKGALLATGDYLLFLNAGDILHPGFNWELLKQSMLESPQMIWGRCSEEYTSGVQIDIKTRTPNWAWYCLPVHHPATFYQRTALPEPVFDTSYEIAADYDLLLRLLKKEPEILYLQSPVSIFRHGGISGTRWKQTLNEEALLRSRHFGFGRVRNSLISAFKGLNRQLAKSASLRKLWRGRV